jgi:hypothetical protein
MNAIFITKVEIPESMDKILGDYYDDEAKSYSPNTPLELLSIFIPPHTVKHLVSKHVDTLHRLYDLLRKQDEDGIEEGDKRIKYMGINHYEYVKLFDDVKTMLGNEYIQQEEFFRMSINF